MTDFVSRAVIAANKTTATGELTEVTKLGLVNAYTALKKKIQQRYGQEHGVVKAITEVEAKPSSAGRQTTLVEEVTETGMEEDEEVRQLAQEVLKYVHVQIETRGQYITHNHGLVQGQNFGEHQQVTQHFGVPPKE